MSFDLKWFDLGMDDRMSFQHRIVLFEDSLCYVLYVTCDCGLASMVLILFSDFTSFVEIHSNFAIKAVSELHKTTWFLNEFTLKKFE